MIEAELDAQFFRLFTIRQHSGWKPYQHNNDNQFTIIKHFLQMHVNHKMIKQLHEEGKIDRLIAD